jgi:hypothetical protein
MKNIFGKITYSFGRVFSKKEMKAIKPRVDYNQVLTDEIFFDNSRSHINGGIIQTVNHVVSNEDVKMTAKGIATTLYNSSLENISEPRLFIKMDPLLFKL